MWATVKHSSPISGKIQEINFIPEGDVYRLIIRSKLPAAEKFERWVFDEVIPSIRKHGVYAVDEVLNNPDMLIAALTELKEERAKAKALEETVSIQSKQIEELQPKANYTDIVLSCTDLMPTTHIAKDYGWSATRLNKFLFDHKIQYRQNGVWYLYQKYAEQEYTGSKTFVKYSNEEKHIKPYTYWTQKGRMFIYNLLKNYNILPIVER